MPRSTRTSARLVPQRQEIGAENLVQRDKRPARRAAAAELVHDARTTTRVLHKIRRRAAPDDAP
ncbi:MAG: hypothetical protein ACTHMS_13650, partial [Jatrophihabitans sp.]|uniref:hypothetical protein n=1 Tax=Jatrophihabitans sp. TaxID=1932789 RepID=UPI003F7EB901